MSTIAFTYYLNDDYTRSELVEWFVENLNISPELATKAAEQRPFYEVDIHCEMDLETGEVFVYGAHN